MSEYIVRNDRSESAATTIERQAKRIAELEARVQELEKWKRIIEGTGTDQEAVIRMAATEYTKVAVQCWKDKVKELEAEVARLNKAMDPIDQECCQLQAKWKAEAQWAARIISTWRPFSGPDDAAQAKQRAKRILDGV